ncbi:hypothetical protein V1511DRAFT_364888 [Dipodascopsis uninucleata]
MKRRATSFIVGTIILCPILYCIYFDYKRRHSRTFRQNIRRIMKQYRKAERQLVLQRYCDLIDDRISQSYRVTQTDQQATASFIVQNLQRADEYTIKEDFEDAALSYYTAMHAYFSPEELLMTIDVDPRVLRILSRMIKLRPFQSS